MSLDSINMNLIGGLIYILLGIVAFLQFLRNYKNFNQFNLLLSLFSIIYIFTFGLLAIIMDSYIMILIGSMMPLYTLFFNKIKKQQLK